MTFRRLYWITERLEEDGSSVATGVYTSVYDLVSRGLPRHTGGLRLTIAKVDSDTDPISSYRSPDFDGLGEDLMAYIKTEELTEDQRLSLLRALSERSQKA